MKFKKYINYSYNKTLISQIIFVLAIIILVFLIEKFSKNNDLPPLETVKRGATLLIDLGDARRMFSGEVIENMTLLDALNASAAAGQIKLAYNVDSNNNTKILEINDHPADDKDLFIFYVNSKTVSPTELNKTYIKTGDKIEVKLK